VAIVPFLLLQIFFDKQKKKRKEKKRKCFKKSFFLFAQIKKIQKIKERMFLAAYTSDELFLDQVDIEWLKFICHDSRFYREFMDLCSERKNDEALLVCRRILAWVQDECAKWESFSQIQKMSFHERRKKYCELLHSASNEAAFNEIAMVIPDTTDCEIEAEYYRAQTTNIMSLIHFATIYKNCKFVPVSKM
jgi:hypothetical protein